MPSVILQPVKKLINQTMYFEVMQPDYILITNFCALIIIYS